MKTLRKFATITGLILGLSAGTPALATADGIADTPLPSLLNASGPTKHVFSVSTIRDGNGMTTSFHCTSTKETGGDDIVWGVEVFDEGTLDNDVAVGEGVMTLFPGQTGVISIANTAAFAENTDLVGIATATERGSARILADSNKLTCSALLLDPDNNPPNFMTPLPVIKKTNQKGQ